MGSAPLFIEYIASRILPDIISIKKKQNNWYFSQMQPDSVWKSRRSVPSGGIVNNARNRLVSDLIMVTGCRLMPCRRNFHRSTHDDDTVCRACANPRVKLHKREAFWGGLERGSYTRGQLQRDFPDDRLNSFEARSWLMNFVLTLEKIIARISCFASSLLDGPFLSSLSFLILSRDLRRKRNLPARDQSLNERFVIKEKPR